METSDLWKPWGCTSAPISRLRSHHSKLPDLVDVTTNETAASVEEAVELVKRTEEQMPQAPSVTEEDVRELLQNLMHEQDCAPVAIVPEAAAQRVVFHQEPNAWNEQEPSGMHEWVQPEEMAAGADAGVDHCWSSGDWQQQQTWDQEAWTGEGQGCGEYPAEPETFVSSLNPYAPSFGPGGWDGEGAGMELIQAHHMMSYESVVQGMGELAEELPLLDAYAQQALYQMPELARRHAAQIEVVLKALEPAEPGKRAHLLLAGQLAWDSGATEAAAPDSAAAVASAHTTAEWEATPSYSDTAPGLVAATEAAWEKDSWQQDNSWKADSKWEHSSWEESKEQGSSQEVAPSWEAPEAKTAPAPAVPAGTKTMQPEDDPWADMSADMPADLPPTKAKDTWDSRGQDEDQWASKGQADSQDSWSAQQQEHSSGVRSSGSRAGSTSWDSWDKSAKTSQAWEPDAPPAVPQPRPAPPQAPPAASWKAEDDEDPWADMNAEMPAGWEAPKKTKDSWASRGHEEAQDSWWTQQQEHSSAVRSSGSRAGSASWDSWDKSDKKPSQSWEKDVSAAPVSSGGHWDKWNSKEPRDSKESWEEPKKSKDWATTGKESWKNSGPWEKPEKADKPQDWQKVADPWDSQNPWASSKPKEKQKETWKDSADSKGAAQPWPRKEDGTGAWSAPQDPLAANDPWMGKCRPAVSEAAGPPKSGGDWNSWPRK